MWRSTLILTRVLSICVLQPEFSTSSSSSKECLLQTRPIVRKCTSFQSLSSLESLQESVDSKTILVSKNYFIITLLHRRWSATCVGLETPGSSPEWLPGSSPRLVVWWAGSSGWRKASPWIQAAGYRLFYEDSY